MSEVINAIILGLVQGLTEFLPVSSSGHLELAKYILGDKALGAEGLLMTVVLHFGTALSTMFVFRKDILEIVSKLFVKGEKENFQFVMKIVLSMIPAAIVGLFFEKQIESLFTQNITLVCLMLVLTAAILYISTFSTSNVRDVSTKDAIIVGIAQAIAITPGISRSGSTIATSVILGIDRAKAAKFSFLMVVPLIFGKIAKDILDGEFSFHSTSYLPIVFGFLAAFFTGIFACKVMIRIVQQSKLIYFAYYCLFVGIAGLIYVYVGS